jgi:transposase
METTDFKFSVDLAQHVYFCGLDVHKQECTAVIYADDNSSHEYTKECVFNTDTTGFTQFWNFAKKYHPHGFAMEATGIFHHIVVRFLEEKQQETPWPFDVVVVNPTDAANLPGHAKSDKIDAKNLARYLAKGLLVSGKMPIGVLEDLKAIFRMGIKIEHQRTALKNRIIKVLDRAGIRPTEFNLNHEWTQAVLTYFIQNKQTWGEIFSGCENEGHPLYPYRTYIQKALPRFAPYFPLSLSPAQSMLIRQNLVELDFQTSRKILLALEVDKILVVRPGLRESAALLHSIAGISPYGAAWILAEIGDIKQFSSVRDFQSYCGCCPTTKATAHTIFFAHTNRHSNQYLRLVFTQAAQVVCNLVKKESELKTYAKRILIKKGPKATKLAHSIIAAKICKIAYAVLRDRKPFRSQSFAKKRSLTSPEGFTLIELKQIRRARNNLKRVAELNNIGLISTEALELANGLEEVLQGKKIRG